MASDFTGNSVPGVWPLLYDDHYVSDHRSFRIWSVPVAAPSGNSVYSLYSDAAWKVWGKRDLLFSARGRCADDHNLCIVCTEDEENCFRKYETIKQEQ